MKQFNYKGNKFEIGLQTICDEEFIVTKGYELEDDVHESDNLSLYIGTDYGQYNSSITVNDVLLAHNKSNYEQNGRTYEKLIAHLEEICNEKEEIDFKCDDFHIKLWQTEDKIGGETVFVREGFEYNHNHILIINSLRTFFFIKDRPFFGMHGTSHSTLSSNVEYSFSDIAEALQQAVEYSKNKGVTFDTFYNECKGKKPEGIVEICKGYEYRLWEFEGGWSDWEEVDYFEFRSKELYNFNLRQIRRKK